MILYIDPQANQYKISPAQSDLINDDWVECQKREDGTYARSYNLDGTPEPDPEPTVNQIKAEAGKRIVAICPEWQQRNYIATSLTFTDMIQDGETLTAEQETQRSEIKALWTTIQGIRTKSDEIEAMTPIPADFKDDSYWI